jgi:hypothetical protein
MSEHIENRLRLAGILIIIGLVIQLATLFWNHPLTFMAFIFVGSPFVAAGIVLYLFSLVRTGS